MYACKTVVLSLFMYFGLALSASCAELVVYTAMDQVFSEPILKEFEQKTGITVKAVYDVEAVKTTGLVNRLLAEKEHPRCDVFWNNEIMRTIMLKRRGILAPYNSPSAIDIPAQFKDKNNFWAGFAARARVLVVNTQLLQPAEYPASVQALTEPRWQGRAALAKPLFGTTATQAACWYTAWGKDKVVAFYRDALANNVRIVDGNSVVRDMVAAGELPWGLTDTDDVHVGVLQGRPIKAILPDQQGEGTLLIPNTVALIAGAPHPAEAKRFIDYLLSREIEGKLCNSESAQIPLRSGIAVPKGQFTIENIVATPIDFEKVTDAMEASVDTVQQYFAR